MARPPKPVAAPQRTLPRALLISAGLALAVLLIYGQTWGFGFVNWDDPEYILQNPNIAGGLTLSSIWWALTTTYHFYWHPWTWFSFLLDYSLFGMSPAGYHLENAALHGAAAIALFASLRALTNSEWPSAFVAALFAVHPLRVESVAWISERKDVWSGLFWFLTLWAYARYVREKGPARYTVVLVLFTLGLMSKPMVVTLPVVLLLVDIWPLARVRDKSLVLEKLPMFALSLAVGVIAIAAQQTTGASAGLADVGFGMRLSNAMVSYVLYLWKTIWPFDLAALYPLLPIPAWQAVLAFLLLNGISLGVWKVRTSMPYLAIGWFWFIVTLLPVIGFTQTGAQAMADRFTYIPQVGLWIALAWSGERWLKSTDFSPAQIGAAAAILLAVLSGISYRQASYWKNSVTLWEHTLSVEPVNYIAHQNLAVVQAQSVDKWSAIKHLTQALQINPTLMEAESNLGGLLAEVGRVKEALPHLERALQAAPNSADAHNNLGTAYGMQGRNDDAMREFQTSLRLNPSQANTHANLGVIYETKGMIPEAISEFQAALTLQPGHEEAARSLARLSAPQKRYAQ